MSMIDNDWLTAISGEFKKEYYRKLYEFVKDEYSKTVIYPPADDIFSPRTPPAGKMPRESRERGRTQCGGAFLKKAPHPPQKLSY